jgi:Terminase RNaseH-like domain
MAGTSIYSVYRRTARAAAKQQVVKKTSGVDVERARTDFAYFCDVVGDKPPAAHHKEWHRYLCTGDDTECLIGIGGPNIDILAPRGSAKSTVLGLYTAWSIGVHALHKKPLKILYISYTVDVARPKSAAIKRIIEENKIYREIFPMVKIAKGINSNEYWSIDWKFAGIKSTGEEEFTICCAGLKGAVTSKRSHLCLTGDTLVHTQRGPTPIYDIYQAPGDYQVPTLNPRTGCLEWSGIRGVSRRLTDRFVHVETSRGDLLRTTPEHPFYIPGRGIIAANDLQVNDQLIELSNCLRDSNQNSMSAVLERVPGEHQLETDVIQKQSQNVLVFEEVCGSVKTNVDLAGMPRMFDRVQAKQLSAPVLFKNMCSQGAFQKNAWENKPSLETWKLQTKQTGFTPSRTTARQYAVRSVRYGKSSVDFKRSEQSELFSCTPYRRESEEQRAYEFNYLVQTMPCGVSSISGKSETFGTTITSISETCGDQEYVYDLETESDNHNFFAGESGYCVANCILDDVVKSADDIKNRDIRQMMEDNWNSVIVPTMFEGGRAICLGTRFRHDDIHNTTFTPVNDWVQIVQSAITVDAHGDEVSYWPDMWSLEYLQDRRRQAPISFGFQYQNQIVQTSELSISPDLIVKGQIPTDFDALGIGVDLSAGIRERNDYTVMVLGGRVGDKIHVIDCKRIRIMGNLEKLESLMEMCYEWGIVNKDGSQYFPSGSNIDVWSEAVAYQASLEADFKRICLGEHGLYNINWHPVKGFRGDKVARFRGIMGLFEQRKIVFNKYRKFQALSDEIVNFGVSSHDDCVDALIWLCNGLMTRGKLELEY